MVDPRNYFASERTLLAWLRTGLALIGFGFALSKVHVIDRLLLPDPSPAALESSSKLVAIIGVLLAVMGSIAILAAAREHASFSRSLREESLPEGRSLWLPPIVAVASGLAGLALAGHIAFEIVAR